MDVNGGLLLEKRISYFDDKYSNPMRSFSAKELQKATDNYNEKLCFRFGYLFKWYKGCFEGRVVLWKVEQSLLGPTFMKVLKWLSMKLLLLLGCCLETRIPILVYEFPSIIHTDIKPSSFSLDQDCAAKLSDFSLSITLPKVKCKWRMKFVELLDTWLLRLLSQVSPRGIHEELQFQAIFDLAMRCSMKDMDERPTIVNATKEVRRI
ncbi:hypothetical protein AAG906_016228 [Vitis piasezkii]